ncbi:aminodeoxychorismate synthase component I [Nocardia nova]|uniref:aminodeoxychorismate synthase component I n=1 Tax=Nocardia nova TaxID=37330 RepID=UPI0033CB3DB9
MSTTRPRDPDGASIDHPATPLRTLLVDNYDSFTYNLHQLIGVVNGAEPTVIRNDDVDALAGLDLDAFDSVVISPGPGHPGSTRDFGISRTLIENAELPLLGVCLGHQGIVLAAGGQVVAAPAPRHGYPDRITHDGSGLFAGIPRDFLAVRYHSLCAAQPLPDALAITATAPDGVVMGVRHRDRPQWGVQFHPESIASEYGEALLRNFARLSREWGRRVGGDSGISMFAERSRLGADEPAGPGPGCRAPRHIGAGTEAGADPRTGENHVPGADTRGNTGIDGAVEPCGTNSEPDSDTDRAPGAHSAPGMDSELGANSGPGTNSGHTTGGSTDTHTATGARDTIATGNCSAAGGQAVSERTGGGTFSGTARATSRTGRATPGSGGTHSPVGAPPAALTVLHEVIDRAVDTESVVLRLYRDSPTVFWLDSAHSEPGLDRFSFVGDASGPLAEVVRYRVGAGCVVSDRAGVRTEALTVLDYLSQRLREREIRFPDVPFDFAGGYVGYLGYEVKADCGAAAAHRSPYPDAQWVFADRLVVVDHVAGRTHLLAVTDAAAAEANRVWLDDTLDVVAALPGWSKPEPLHLPADESAVTAGLTRGRDRYLADIAAVDAELRAGQTYEVNLTDSTEIRSAAAGLDVYRTLRRSNPAPYAAYLRFGELEIACSSPERFLKIDRTRTVETKPIKGTAPRGATAAADDNLRRTLELDPKTRAENLMIVDLLRNDLGRVCELGSVHVPELMVAETYTTMHQLVSTVRGRLRPEIDVIDCLRACFPGGSMTGAPKLRTMEIIDGLETEARGIYSGTIGFLGLGGTADLNIVIRTAIRDASGWRVGAGGAIVLDSDAESEFHEMVLKAAAALRAVTLVAGTSLTTDGPAPVS